jgi:hypothetical protein
MKTKKKSKKSTTKKSTAQPIEQRRHEYETAKREQVLERITKNIETYNAGQEKRDDLIQRLYNVSMRQRARIQKKVDAEIARQQERVEKHDVLRKLGVVLKVPALTKAVLPKFDAEALQTPLRLSGKPSKAKAKGKVRKRTKAASSTAHESNGEA